MLVKEDEDLKLQAHHGNLTLRIPEGGKVPAGAGLWGRALRESKTVIENEPEADPDCVGIYLESVARMCIPLVSFGQTLGVLVLDSTQPGSFLASDIQSLESVADICATAIQNAHYVERVKHLAYLDGLTGIFNRRYFELRIQEELERARRFNSGMAVIMVDIDQFKGLNDEFGHLLGDEVLRQVSSIFSQQLRKIDVVCRYGGEEFAILLSQTSQQQALAVAEKLRRMVDSLAISRGIAAGHHQRRSGHLARSWQHSRGPGKSGRRRTVCRQTGRQKLRAGSISGPVWVGHSCPTAS